MPIQLAGIQLELLKLIYSYAFYYERIYQRCWKRVTRCVVRGVFLSEQKLKMVSRFISFSHGANASVRVISKLAFLAVATARPSFGCHGTGLHLAC